MPYIPNDTLLVFESFCIAISGVGGCISPARVHTRSAPIKKGRLMHSTQFNGAAQCLYPRYCLQRVAFPPFPSIPSTEGSRDLL